MILSWQIKLNLVWSHITFSTSYQVRQSFIKQLFFRNLYKIPDIFNNNWAGQPNEEWVGNTNLVKKFKLRYGQLTRPVFPTYRSLRGNPRVLSSGKLDFYHWFLAIMNFWLLFSKSNQNSKKRQFKSRIKTNWNS